MIEFTLVGIPLVFVLISIFEMARGMWVYHTLAYAVKDAMRFVIVHGKDYDELTTDPTKLNTVLAIAQRVQWAGVGLNPEDLTLELTSGSGTVRCSPLSSCLPSGDPPSSGTLDPWPVYPDNLRGATLVIRATYPFRSALSMFWPGAGPGMVFGTYTFAAYSRERVQF